MINAPQMWLPSGWQGANLDRRQAPIGDQAMLASGRLQIIGGLTIPAGARVSQINVVTGNTAGATITNQWAGLALPTTTFPAGYLALTNDLTSAAMGANTPIAYPFASAQYFALETAVWVLLCVAATTMPSLRGVNTSNVTNGGATGFGAALAGTANTGLTTPASLVQGTISAVTAVAQNAYVGWS